ncbi:hypothetical protein SNEBB_008376 [Seison nebaliae]|nr:hypothetical protein SNEBB_008376 [Seison nebaliae]
MNYINALLIITFLVDIRTVVHGRLKTYCPSTKWMQVGAICLYYVDTEKNWYDANNYCMEEYNATLISWDLFDVVDKTRHIFTDQHDFNAFHGNRTLVRMNILKDLQKFILRNSTWIKLRLYKSPTGIVVDGYWVWLKHYLVNTEQLMTPANIKMTLYFDSLRVLTSIVLNRNIEWKSSHSPYENSLFTKCSKLLLSRNNQPNNVLSFYIESTSCIQQESNQTAHLSICKIWNCNLIRDQLKLSSKTFIDSLRNTNYTIEFVPNSVVEDNCYLIIDTIQPMDYSDVSHICRTIHMFYFSSLVAFSGLTELQSFIYNLCSIQNGTCQKYLSDTNPEEPLGLIIGYYHDRWESLDRITLPSMRTRPHIYNFGPTFSDVDDAFHSSQDLCAIIPAAVNNKKSKTKEFLNKILSRNCGTHKSSFFCSRHYENCDDLHHHKHPGIEHQPHINVTHLKTPPLYYRQKILGSFFWTFIYIVYALVLIVIVYLSQKNVKNRLVSEKPKNQLHVANKRAYLYSTEPIETSYDKTDFVFRRK